jgi:transcriptional regulator of acetoin/glycerol metabolism
MTVHHLEHFRTTNRSLTCSASPIFAGDGSLIAVLDASALESPDDRRSQHLVLKMVDATSRMIGDAYFLRQYQNQLVLRTSGHRDFLEITTDGLLAFDAGGRVIGVNQQFQYDYGQSRDSLLGLHVQDLFGVNYESLISAVDKNDPIQLRLIKSGSQCFALARAPRRPPLAHGLRTSGITQSSPESRLTALAGFDAKMHANVQKALRVMDKGVAVLLQGESGTGKEEFAKAMHESSQRAGAPLVALNCSAIPETLIESELFGYREGAFTGARANGAKGKIVQAQHGTLFLDEIGDMPLALQSRLLRVLAEREVVPLGAERATAVDFQLICATHRDLLKLVETGQFRHDLYYRLNGMTLTLPALRARTDLSALIGAILTQEAVAASTFRAELSADARTLLLAYSWPGNIRQLKNALRSALALCDGSLIEVEHLPDEIGGSARPVFPPQRLFSPGWSPAPFVANEMRPVPEEVALLQALQEHNWNISDAARSLNLNRSTVYRRMAAHKIIQPNKR